jgi:16S rRNA (guanine527-N7)-methyltransferase
VAPRDFRTRLARRASKAGISLTDDLSAALATYYELLARWNKKINLTALTDPDDAIDRLLLEPLIAARYLPARDGRLMDIGSGGGSPAIPLKLATPGLMLTMVEAKARKSAFLREAVRQLGLSQTEVENARYEELLTRPELHDRHHAVSIRAVRLEARALVTLQAFLRPLGVMMLFRGPDGVSESQTFFPPLEHVQTVPLLEATHSRLTLLAKRPIGSGGGAIVPRGT